MGQRYPLRNLPILQVLMSGSVCWMYLFVKWIFPSARRKVWISSTSHNTPPLSPSPPPPLSHSPTLPLSHSHTPPRLRGEFFHGF